MESGGKLAYSYGGVEPRKFGLGLVAGLLVACAYFSTVKLDAIRIAMSKQLFQPQALSSRAKNAAGIGSQANIGENWKQRTLDLDSDLVVADDDPSAVVALPPFSSDSSDRTQESGVLADQKLQVQNAIAAAANPHKESNSISSNHNGSSYEIPSDPAEIPVPAPTPEIETPSSAANEMSDTSSEVKAPPLQMTPPIPEVKQTGWEAPVREWKPLCDLTSNYRIDWCELEGDVRVVGSNASVTLVAPPGADNRTFHEESWSIKPYPRKGYPYAMHSVRALTVRSSVATATATDAPPPACTDRQDVPALVFSVRGYTDNYFHAYTDVILPLFLTARQYSGEVLLLVTGFQAWWVGKYLPVFRSLSNYAPVDLDRDGPRVRCFWHVQVGLTSHDDFSIDPRRAPNGYSMLDFTQFMRATYGLPRAVAIAPAPVAAALPDQSRQGRRRPRPRLLVIARARTRRFLNTEEIVRGARKVGFEVVVSEGKHEVAPFVELVNTCDAVVGVHGAGLTNMVFLPRGGVVVQVLPLGPLEFVGSYFRGPARDMGLTYLEYRISPEESTLVDQYPRDHPVLTDSMNMSSKAMDWVSSTGVYLYKQDVRLDLKRFRPVLKKALARLTAKPKTNNN